MVIELTAIVPFGDKHRTHTWRVVVMVNQITHISEYDAARKSSEIHLLNGSTVVVAESMETVCDLIRKDAEPVRSNVPEEKPEGLKSDRISQTWK